MWAEVDACSDVETVDLLKSDNEGVTECYAGGDVRKSGDDQWLVRCLVLVKQVGLLDVTDRILLIVEEDPHESSLEREITHEHPGSASRTASVHFDANMVALRAQ